MSLWPWHGIVTGVYGYLKTAWEFSAGTEVVGAKVQFISTKKVYHLHTAVYIRTHTVIYGGVILQTFSQFI